MDFEQQNQRQFPDSGSSGLINQPKGISKLSNFIETAQTKGTINFVSAILQIFLGITVIIASIAGLIESVWLAAVLSIVASIACVVGIYMLYIINNTGYGSERLIREAMRRIMNAQN